MTRIKVQYTYTIMYYVNISVFNPLSKVDNDRPKTKWTCVLVCEDKDS
jgi:hypothetical protein